MPASQFTASDFEFKPVTLSVWDDFVSLFTEPGIQNGCWCMYWRLRRADCQHGYGEGNKQAFKAVLESGQVPGILAYHQGQPVGWCAIAPRQDTSVLDRSPTLKRVDDQPVWSITCFFISKPYRRQGMTESLIRPRWITPANMVPKLSKPTRCAPRSPNCSPTSATWASSPPSSAWDSRWWPSARSAGQ